MIKPNLASAVALAASLLLFSGHVFAADDTSSNDAVQIDEDLAAYAGEWEGLYACNDGHIKLRFEIDEQANPATGALDGVLYFWPTPGGMEWIIAGSWNMSVERTADPSIIHLRFTDWIDQPVQPTAGGEMIGYRAFDFFAGPVQAGAGPMGGTFSGLSRGHGICQVFQVFRVG